MPTELTILMPVYNDWESAVLVINALDKNTGAATGSVSVLLVDDGSLTPCPSALLHQSHTHLAGIEVLRLRRNLGHQRAIAIGLSFLYAERDSLSVLVMDADGEDQPSDVPRLREQFEQLQRRTVVFAGRRRRSEGWVFRACYHTYRFVHWALTGIPVRVGNFSILAREHLAALVVAPDLWNHYAATVLKTKLPHEAVPTARGRRSAGQSQLNFAAMVIHGLSAISVFIELVSVRLSLIMGAFLLMLLVGGGGLIALQWTKNFFIPTWAGFAGGLMILVVMQMLTVALALTLVVLFQRNSLSFLPLRDYRYFISDPPDTHAEHP